MLSRMRLTVSKKVFVLRCSFHEREIAKKAGFRWHPGDKVWYTPRLAVASRLREYADDAAKRILNRYCLEYKPWAGAIPHPPDLEPFDFQLDAVKFALDRNKSYLGLDPGLGKTICAALIINALKLRPALYICPPFLTRNVENELKKWCLLNPNRISRELKLGTSVLIVPDSKLYDLHTKTRIKNFVLYCQNQKAEPMVFVDEAHRYKNASAQRTRALFDIVGDFEKIIFLSGSPMPNRPMELYSILSNLVPETIDYLNRFEFGMKYCAGFKGPWGYDFSGASNVEELASRVKGPFMLRLKKDVLKLPPRLQEIVFLEDEMPPLLAEMERKLLAYCPNSDYIKEGLEAQDGEKLHLATYRKLLGEMKTAQAIKYLQFILEDGEAVLVFAHHKEVISKLSTGLRKYLPMVIDGKTPMAERHAIQERFKESNRHNLVILNLQAGGIGFNFTKATRVVFTEFSWVPGENDQAIDRAHRIGQKQTVLAQYLVFKDSIDEKILISNFKKRATQKHF